MKGTMTFIARVDEEGNRIEPWQKMEMRCFVPPKYIPREVYDSVCAECEKRGVPVITRWRKNLRKITIGPINISNGGEE